MPAQVEEAVVGSNPVQPEHLGEHLAQGILPRRGRPRPRRGRPRSRGPAGRCRVDLPVGVSGSASSTTTAAGTMYSGSRPAANARTASARPPSLPVAIAGRTVGGGPRQPGRHRRPAADRPARPAARSPRPAPRPGERPAPPRPRRARPGTRGSSPDHRPGPGTPAPRPRSTAPRSPVRYIRDPSAANGHATNRSAVSPGRPPYPRASPAPATYSSPATPAGTGPATVQHDTPRVPGSGPPTGAPGSVTASRPGQAAAGGIDGRLGDPVSGHHPHRRAKHRAGPGHRASPPHIGRHHQQPQIRQHHPASAPGNRPAHRRNAARTPAR